MTAWGMCYEVSWEAGDRAALSSRLLQESKMADNWLAAPSDAIEKAPSKVRNISHLAKGYLGEICRAKIRALDVHRIRLWPKPTPPLFCAMLHPTTGHPFEFGLASSTMEEKCYVFRIDKDREPIAYEAMLTMYRGLLADGATGGAR